MITGEKEYDVYVLIEHKHWWQWLFWWSVPSYEIVLGASFSTAEEAAKSAQIKTNAAGGKAIGIAADAIVCCREKLHTVGGAGSEVAAAAADGSKGNPIPCVPHTHAAGDQYCVYRIIDKEVPDAGDGGIGLQQVVCIVCTEDDQSCETSEFWIETRSGRYQLTPKDPPGSDFCRNCPDGGHTFKKFK